MSMHSPSPANHNQNQNVVNVVNGRPGYGHKSVGVAYALLICLGLVGAHHFYLGNNGRGILYACTLGLFGVGAIIDLFTLPSQTHIANARIGYRGF